jgi:hypothetical protein
VGNILAFKVYTETEETEPLPLNLSDTEILDWMTEYCDQAVYNRPTAQYRGGFTLYCDEIKTTGETLREAVNKAAAKFAAENADY